MNSCLTIKTVTVKKKDLNVVSKELGEYIVFFVFIDGYKFI